jgi:VWFA-related protein
MMNPDIHLEVARISPPRQRRLSVARRFNAGKRSENSASRRRRLISGVADATREIIARCPWIETRDYAQSPLMRRKVARFAGCTLLFAMLCGPVTLGQNAPPQTPRTAMQQPQPEQEQSVRIKTELIELRAVVTDKQGRAVTDLKQDDFELSENGKPQEVSFFSAVKIPGRGEPRAANAVNAAATPGEPRPPRQGDAPGRAVVLYVDTLHLSIDSLMRAKQALRKFIDERLTDDDLSAIVTSAGSLGVVEQFTRDRRILRRAVDRLSPRPNARASLLTPYIAAQVDRNVPGALQIGMAIVAAEERLPPNDPFLRTMTEQRARQVLTESTYLRRASLLTLREVVQRMSDLPGQRLIVMLSDGFALYDQGGQLDSADLQAVTSRATRSGVVIYTIDAKGLAAPAMFDASIGAMPQNPQVGSEIAAGERDLENSLNALAKDTGGEAFFNSNDTLASMSRALSDNEHYYALAYYPAGEEKEKKFRKITIKIRNHPEYQVRAQHGYLPADLAKKAKEAESQTPQQRFVNAMLAPLPMTAIGVTASADYLEVPSDGAQASLSVLLDARTLSSRDEGGRTLFDAEIVTMLFNAEGKRVDVKSDMLRGSLLPSRWSLALQNGFVYTRRVPLKPGLYQLRVGVREPNGGERYGTAAAWVDVPDLTKKRLAMSSLFLTDAVEANLTKTADETGPAPSPSPSPSPSKVVQGIRFYKAGQKLIYLFRVYLGPKPDETSAGAQMKLEILKEEKVVMDSPWGPVGDRMLGKDAKGYQLGGQIGSVQIPPGIYELRVSVKSDKMKKPVQRTIAFGIER